MKTTEQEMFICGEVEYVTKCSGIKFNESHAFSGADKAIELSVLSVLTVYDESVRSFYKKERMFFYKILAY